MKRGARSGIARLVPWGLAALPVAASALFIATWMSLKPVPKLSAVMAETSKPQLQDRNGIPLTTTYQNRWNRHDIVPLHRIPLLLQKAFVTSEDRRFFEHGGMDWQARLHALWQNLSALRKKRGASTISEQVVRMLHPRPRTLWSRWLEGFEARRLEAVNNKAGILEFYLNQVPYAGHCRGVSQAAKYYFNRDLSTLAEKEMLALAVMVRAPAYLNAHYNPQAVEKRVAILAQRLRRDSAIDQAAGERIERQHLYGSKAYEPAQAGHFARYVFGRIDGHPANVRTTVDSDIQAYAQRILNQRMDLLDDKNIDNGALLVVDHTRNEVLAWIVGRSELENAMAVAYDSVLTPRQPGSTLKPFVYALALTRGWTAATLIDDSPLSESVGHGLHTYHNYSRVHYGSLSLRESLGNSLNIPAVKAMQFVGATAFLDTLRKLGFDSLDQHPDYYGDGLALGNGEVTLFELVQAYSVLARGGIFEPLRVILDERAETPRRVFSEAVASLVGHILSDADARRLEFSGNLLNLPVQTAVKTGTSSDYRDAWAIGYDYRFVVGVWMGNLKGEPMNEITGSTGPALVLRSVFSELNRNRNTRPLFFSPLLVKRPVCIETGYTADGNCSRREEWFITDMPAAEPFPLPRSRQELRIRQPHNGLQMALDPRIPDAQEAFSFQINQQENIEQVDWYLNGALIASSRGHSYDWPVQRGKHVLVAMVRRSGSAEPDRTGPVEFLVK